MDLPWETPLNGEGSLISRGGKVEPEPVSLSADHGTNLGG